MHACPSHREYMMDQAAQIQHLQHQIELMQTSQAGTLHLMQAKVIWGLFWLLSDQGYF